MPARCFVCVWGSFRRSQRFNTTVCHFDQLPDGRSRKARRHYRRLRLDRRTAHALHRPDNVTADGGREAGREGKAKNAAAFDGGATQQTRLSNPLPSVTGMENRSSSDCKASAWWRLEKCALRMRTLSVSSVCSL